MCVKSGCKCQKQLTFSPEQYQLEGGSIENKMEKFLQRDGKNLEKTFRTGFENSMTMYRAAISVKRKRQHKIGEATSTILKSISGGKILSSTDMLANGLIFEVKSL